MTKKPFYFNWDTGACGTFIKKEKGNKHDTSDIIFRPLDFSRTKKDTNIPNALITDTINMPDKPGVVQSGYVFVVEGNLATRIQLFRDENLKMIQQALTDRNIAVQLANEEAAEAERGVIEKVKRQAEFDETLRKPKKYMPPGGRWSEWEENEYE